jgi:predicted tellurium resistance membrane protein TerC
LGEVVARSSSSGCVTVEGDLQPRAKSEAALLAKLRSTYSPRLRINRLPRSPRIDGRLLTTPLFIVLMMVETTDLVFAIDSIPAILAITTDSFIVYTSNIFAILGLRVLYFALAGVMDLFAYLHYGLASVLVFVGAKMLLDAG